MLIRTAFFFAFACAVTPAGAESRRVFLETGDGEQVQVATLETEGSSYTLAWNATVFDDHFLSMRPFKCVDGGEKLWCHVPYPYEIKRDIGEDLTDLEYDLLFVWKGVDDYGIDMWNGAYYQLERKDSGWMGTLNEIDLGGLAVPPPPGELRPIREKDLHPADADSHTFPVIVIE